MRVVVAMSGGVDSSAAAALLVEQGHEVLGITLRVWSYEGAARCGSCCSPDDIDDARAVASPARHPVLRRRCRGALQAPGGQPFVQSYLDGKTPVPCVACNRDVKFDFLLARARALGARLATGHYARIERTDGTAPPAARRRPVQGPELLPLHPRPGGARRARVPGGRADQGRGPRHRRSATACPPARSRRAWRSASSPTVTTPASWSGSPARSRRARWSTAAGQVLARHAGVHRFTVGQRRGLGVAAGEPLYVQRIDAGAGAVVVGPASGARALGVHRAPAVLGASTPPPEERVHVRIRHRHAGTPARVVAADARSPHRPHRGAGPGSHPRTGRGVLPG